MKTAIVYYSQSGQTRRIADVIAGELEEVRPAHIEDCDQLPEADLVFFGTPIEQSGPPRAVRTYLADKCDGRRIALFVTHAADGGMPELAGWLEACRAVVSDAGGEVAGCFDCQAELAGPVKQYMLACGRPELAAWAEADTSQGKPDGASLAKAAAFAREIVAAEQG